MTIVWNSATEYIKCKPFLDKGGGGSDLNLDKTML